MPKAAFSDDVMRVIRAAAPVVGGLLGSAIPLPGVGTAIGVGAANIAVEALGKALGVPPTVDAIEDRVRRDLDEIERLTPTNGEKAFNRDVELKAKLNEANDVALAQIASNERLVAQQQDNDNTASARATFGNTKDTMQRAIGALVVLGFMVMIGFIAWREIPAANRDLFLMMATQLAAGFLVILNYLFGSSEGARRLSNSMQNLAGRR